MGETKKEILTRLKNIESKLDMILCKVESVLPQEDKQAFGDIVLAMEITGLAKPTLYSLISRRQIPSYKQGKKLYFKRKELEDWIQSSKRKTEGEIRKSIR